jgi:2,3-bisphosphoglycerate-dependent phosphoglycerate mutase
MKISYEFVLLRHGESIWNLENRFTGWTDVPLTARGVLEARLGAKVLMAKGLSFDQMFTSVLSRALHTLWIVQEVMNLTRVPVECDWRLNERHYGALQGQNKAETAERLGKDQVFAWRRSFTGRPPELSWDDLRHPRFDARYAHLDPTRLPGSESLADTLARVLPFWFESCVPQIIQGKRLLIVAHGNSLRALVKHLDNLSNEEVPALNIPTGVPLFYRLNTNLAVTHREFFPIS